MNIVTDIEKLKKSSETILVSEYTGDLEAEIKQYLSDNENAMGLAAVQIGIPVRLAVFKTAGPHSAENEMVVLINPVIKDKYDTIITSESCLSFPGEAVTTKRFNYCVVESDELVGHEFEKRTRVFEGRLAVCAQHEIDHLDGKTMHDRIYKASATVGRNERCICGSGKKFKHCCMLK